MALVPRLAVAWAINAAALWAANALWDGVHIHGWTAYLIGGLVYKVGDRQENRDDHRMLQKARGAGMPWAPPSVLFELLQQNAAPLEEVKAFPNPLRPSQGQPSMTFANLPVGNSSML